MYISRVAIENFRSLRKTTVELRPGLNVVVGRNNVGKSNLVDAIRHALGPTTAAGDLPRLEKSDFFHVDGQPQPIRVEISFAALTEEDRTSFFEMLVPNLADLSKSSARLLFEAAWTERGRADSRRSCGPATADRSAVPGELLEALPVTFLPALRDAQAALTPGYRNRLARLLESLGSDEEKGAIVGIFKSANESLEKEGLIKETQDSIRASAKRLSGTDFSAPSIRAAPPDVTRVLRSLHLTLDDDPVDDVASSGLGYQNILYIATVLAHLATVRGGDCPLLVVEEPEAHVHPQLLVLLGESLSDKQPGQGVPQTLVTTHSPTFAANVAPEQVIVMQYDARAGSSCRAVARAGLEEGEGRALQRMMDITRSSLYFAKGAILVEGISEALLLPVFAKRLGYDLKKLHISVIPICGVAFGTLSKLLRDDVLGVPVAIVSDGDPPVTYPDTAEKNWREALPEAEDGLFLVSGRTTALIEEFAGHECVAVCRSKVTLEYDLASAGPQNPLLMVEVWESLFAGTPRTLNTKMLETLSDHDERVLAVWRGVCIAKTQGSKADFAHRLADELDPDRNPASVFPVPEYIKSAIEFVAARTSKRPPEVGSRDAAGDAGVEG